MNAKTIVGVLKETVSDWIDDKASRLAAALAFYTLLSIAPLLVLVVAVAGLVFGEDAARGEIGGQLRQMMGEQAGAGVEALLASARSPSEGIVATVVSVVVLFFGASGVFGELQDSLNTVWEVAPKPGRGILGVIKDRFFSFTMVLGVAFLLLVSLVISAALSALGGHVAPSAPEMAVVWQVVNFIVSLASVTVLFALMFKVIPDVKIAWKNVWIGALATSLLFTIGKLLLGLYLGRASVASPYGAAGSLVVLVIWVYYSAQILFLGAELTQVYARTRGAPIEPTKNAIPLAAARAATSPQSA
jgi:membrane protein